MKICSLYGAGYYYIPGTDVCMRIGGYIRQEWSYGYGDNMTAGMWVSSSMQNTRTNGARDLVWRTRAYITQETRQQTAYGTLRTFLNVGLSGNNSIDFSANRAFIQIAGFTAGLASSYFDHYSVAAIAYLVDQASDTGDGGRQVFAYTAQLGNGISASISAEAPEVKTSGVWSTSLGGAGAAAITGANPTLGTALNNNHRKANIPDIVANIRADGAWGSFQVMAALHESSGGYYGTTLAGAQNFGNPPDILGWAVGAGLRVNLPMLGPGDYVAAQAVYAEGATRYVSNTTLSSGQAGFEGGHLLGYGLSTDGVFATGTNVELTTSWGIAAGWEHFWTPSLRTSIHGSYVAIRYNATANDLLCGAQTNTTANTVNYSVNTTGVACNNNWAMWQIGSRTQWNLSSSFYMGFDVVYYRLETASEGAIVNYNALATGAQPAGLRTLADQEALAVRVRWHRDLP